MVGVSYVLSKAVTSDVCARITRCEEVRQDCWANSDLITGCAGDSCVHQFNFGQQVFTRVDSCQNNYILCKRRIWKQNPDDFNECNRDMEAYDAGEAKDIKGQDGNSPEISE